MLGVSPIGRGVDRETRRPMLQSGFHGSYIHQFSNQRIGAVSVERVAQFNWIDDLIPIRRLVPPRGWSKDRPGQVGTKGEIVDSAAGPGRSQLLVGSGTM